MVGLWGGCVCGDLEGEFGMGIFVRGMKGEWIGRGGIMDSLDEQKRIFEIERMMSTAICSSSCHGYTVLVYGHERFVCPVSNFYIS